MQTLDRLSSLGSPPWISDGCLPTTHTSSHSRLMKYADKFVAGNSCNSNSDQVRLDGDLPRLVTWRVEYRLIMNKSKCASFIPKYFLLPFLGGAQYLDGHFFN